MKSYYRVHSGPVFDILKKHIDAIVQFRKALTEWGKLKGFPFTAHRNGYAFYFEDGFVPDKKVWKKEPRGGYSARENTKDGKAVHSELAALPKEPGWMHLIQEFQDIGGGGDIMKVNTVGTPAVAKKKEDAFYLLHIDTYWLPEDLTGLEEIKASEYA